MKLYRFPYNDFQVNSYVIVSDNSNAIVIDPAFYSLEEQNHFLKFVESIQCLPKMVLLTHPHIDHILGVKFCYDSWGIVPRLNYDGIQLYQSAESYGSAFGFSFDNSVIPESDLFDEEEILLDDIQIVVKSTPGHAPGSSCFYLPQYAMIFSGDVLFQGSIGRTDLPGGDFDVLMQSIKTKLLVLPDDTTVFPGHGMETSIGIEKKENPFLV